MSRHDPGHSLMVTVGQWAPCATCVMSLVSPMTLYSVVSWCFSFSAASETNVLFGAGEVYLLIPWLKSLAVAITSSSVKIW